MGNIKAKPAHPRGKARASESVVAGQRDSQKFNRTRTEKQAGEITCYSGLNMTGWLQPRNGRWLAFAADGRFLGSHSSDRLGASAIYQASRPGGSA